MNKTKKTHKNILSEEEIALLDKNPYIENVSSTTVKYTDEFKMYFAQQHAKGVPYRQILINCGIDPEILGRKRIDGLSYSINKKIKNGESFADKRKQNSGNTSKSGNQPIEARMKQLEHELAYARQEVEFLKKLQEADMEAKKQWESRHRQK